MLPILTLDFTPHKYLKDSVLDMISQEESIKIDEHWGIDNITRSDWYVENKEIKPYWKTLLPHITKIVEPVIMEKFFFKGWNVTNYWYQQYNKGDEHTWHFHGATLYNFVYYLEKPDDAPGTEIMFPITGQVVEPVVKEGQILVFPSIFRHRSSRSLSDGRKTIVAWNIDIR